MISSPSPSITADTPGRAGVPAILAESHPFGRFVRLALVAAALGAAVIVEVPLCPFAIVTRHPCPGCGLTRATLALARGDVAGAVHLHPLSPLLVPIVIVAFGYSALSYVRGGAWFAAERIQGRWITIGSLALTVILLAVWIARFMGALGGPVPV